MTENTQMLCELLADQIEEATREHLFGETTFLPTLDYNDSRVRFYVSKREGDAIAVGGETNPYAVENAFLGKLWPNRRGKQLILVRGGGGSGKTTFLRFFFQFYLVHKERLGADFAKKSPPLSAEIYEKHAHQHLVLYADLRRAHSLDAGGLRAYLFKKLGESLRDTLADQRRPIDEIPADIQSSRATDEAWVVGCCDWLARLNENGSRKWYVSWFLDNGDYLNEEEQKALVAIIKEFIPHSPPRNPPSDPINDKKWMLWRVILPVRPETLENLSPLWSPLDADSDFELGMIDFDDLHDKRGRLLHDEISQSAVHVGMDRTKGGVKPYFDILPPEEIADAMEDAWRVATKLQQGAKQIISPEAYSILVDLSHDSARRRIKLFARAALSHCFMVRYRRAEVERWEKPPLVSDYFLFHGLLCGKSNQFELEVEGLPILNAFALDLDTLPVSAHSIMIGPHSIYLLSQGQSWNKVTAELSKIGYDTVDIKSFEQRLINKEVLKSRFDGEFKTKLPIVRGLWRLIKEDAYVDSMAVACAKAWHDPNMATVTDPLDISKVVQRFSGSVAFLKRLWWAERTVFTYTSHLSSTCGEFQHFSAKVAELSLPSITNYVASSYRRSIGKLPDYDAPAEAIRLARVTWSTCLKTLDDFVADSNKPSMSATQR